MLTALVFAKLVLARTPTVCGSIQAGDLPAVQKLLQGKRTLPTCPYPPEFLAVAGAKDEAGLAMLDLVVSKGGKVDITLEGSSLLASATTAQVVRGLIKRGVVCQPTDLETVTDQPGFDVGAATAMVEAGCPIKAAIVGAAKSAPLTKLMLERGANPNDRTSALTALQLAAIYSSLPSAQLLIAAGADVSPTSASGLTATDLAVRSVELLQFLLAHGGRITRFDDALVRVAESSSPTREAAFQVLQGLEPKLGPGDFKAVHACARLGLVDLASKLVKLGATPDARVPKSKLTPLMTAIHTHQSALANEWVAFAADVDATDARGNTALMLAAEQNDVAFTKALLARKANQALKNAEGKTAVVLAEEARSMETLALLAPDAAAPGVDAIIWGGGTTQADGEKWLELWNNEAASTSRLLTLAPGYPQVVKSDDVPGLKPGFVVVLLGTCQGADARYTVGLLKGVAERVYARRIKATTTACPTRQNGLQRARMAVTTGERGTRLQAAEVWNPNQLKSEVWVSLRTKEGALLDQTVVPGTSSSCRGLTLDASPGLLEVVTTCDEESNGGKCMTDSGPVATKFSALKGKLRKVVDDQRETRCHDFYIGGCD